MKTNLYLTLVLVGCALFVGCTSTTNKAATSLGNNYQPQIKPEDFLSTITNPYLPFVPGTTYIYEGQTEDGTERIEVEVLTETKVVMGVTATIVRDTVYLNGEIIEDTFDWFAQDKEGNVWYFGEETKEYENGQPINTAGAWEAGVDGALPGIVMPAHPQGGQTYRQEYYLGEAEDMAEILSLNESITIAYGSFANVVQTKDWTPLDPTIVEHKFYAPGIGLILETKVQGGDARIELIEFQSPNQP